MGRNEQLDTILSLTDKMKSAAEQGEWVTVAEQEQSRLKLIHELFAEPVSQDDSEAVREAINHIIDIDQEIMSKAVDAKNVIHDQVKRLSVEKHAFEEYAKNR
jgi:hypothetical protein